MKNIMSFYVAGQYVFDPRTKNCVGRLVASNMIEGDGKTKGITGWYKGVTLEIEFYDEANMRPDTEFVPQKFTNAVPFVAARAIKV